MQLRLALTLAYGAFLGVWVYTDAKGTGGLFGELHGSIPFEVFVLVLAVAVGFAVRRWWVLLALLGPLASLGYLELTAGPSPWIDGNAPLLSPPGIAFFFRFGAIFLLGLALGSFWERRRVPQGSASSA